jgi:hypothetical protein
MKILHIKQKFFDINTLCGTKFKNYEGYSHYYVWIEHFIHSHDEKYEGYEKCEECWNHEFLPLLFLAEAEL